jgi:hypothetical protein
MSRPASGKLKVLSAIVKAERGINPLEIVAATKLELSAVRTYITRLRWEEKIVSAEPGVYVPAPEPEPCLLARHWRGVQVPQQYIGGPSV